MCRKTGAERFNIGDRRSEWLKQVDRFKYIGSLPKEGGGCESGLGQSESSVDRVEVR